jgi:hypothetical protein
LVPSATASTSSQLSTGAKADIGAGVALVATGFLVLSWFLCVYKRKHKIITQLATSDKLVRNTSTTYRKPELEGDYGDRFFHDPGNPS